VPETLNIPCNCEETSAELGWETARFAMRRILT
jgi:hypothetical protein